MARALLRRLAQGALLLACGTATLIASADPLHAGCATPPSFAGLSSVVSSDTSTCAVALAWPSAVPACGGTITYSIHRSATAGFVPSLLNRVASGVTGTSFVDDAALVDGASYEYVVRAIEASAQEVEDGNLVRRTATPRGPSAWNAVFVDDFDQQRPPTPEAYWTQLTGPAAGTQLVDGCRWHSPTTALRLGPLDPDCGAFYLPNLESRVLLGGDGTAPGVDGIVIPPSTGSRLRLRRWFIIEEGFDFFSLFLSTTSAAGPWTYLDVWTGSGTGANGEWPEVILPLGGATAGTPVWLQLELRTDSIVEYSGGVQLDDVRIEALQSSICTTSTPPPGDPARFTISGLSEAVVAGELHQLEIHATDVFGQLATGYSGTAQLAASDPAATHPAAATFRGGIAGASISFRTAGPQIVTASDLEMPALTATASTIVAAAAPVALSWATQPGDVTAGTAFAPAPTVRVVDEFGNLVSSATDAVTLALATNPDGGTVLGPATSIASGGIATFPGISVDRAGSGHTLVATAPDRASAASSPFAVSPAAPHHLALSSQPSSIVAGEPFVPAVVVVVQDSFDNLVPSAATVTLSLAGPGGAALLGTTTRAAVDGIAHFPGISVDRAGTGRQIVATSWPLGGTISQPFDVVAGSPYRVTFEAQPTDTTIGRAIAPAVALALRDVYDNLCLASERAISIAIANNPAGAHLSGSTTVIPAGGIATFPDLALDRVGLNFTLFAGASGLFGASSVGFDVLPLEVFVDGFETGSTDRWSSTEAIMLVPTLLAQPRDELSLALPLAAALAGVPRSGKPVALLVAADQLGRATFVLELRRDPATDRPQLRASTVASLGDWSDLPEDAAMLEIRWWRAQTSSSDGLLLVDIGRHQLSAVPGLPDTGPIEVLWRVAHW